MKIALYSRYSNNKCGIVMNIVRNFTIRPTFAPKISSANCPSLINNFSGSVSRLLRARNKIS